MNLGYITHNKSVVDNKMFQVASEIFLVLSEFILYLSREKRGAKNHFDRNILIKLF